MNNFNFSSRPESHVGREIAQLTKEECALTPFRVQNIVYEILEQHLLINDPEKLGYPFTQKYNTDETKSQIFIDISNNWKAGSAQKRPAVFVYRGDAQFQVGPNTFGQTSFINVAESETGLYTKVQMPIILNCIAGPVGFAETFADYIKYPFLYFWKNIQEEYCFRRFKLVNISAPEQFTIDAKDSFSVKLTIMTEFYDMWGLIGDDLKLKTVAQEIYLEDGQNPLSGQ